jgi:uncharacterized protein (TIGR02466 family)
MIENIFPIPIYRKNYSKEILNDLDLFIKSNSFEPTQKINSTKGGFQSNEEFLNQREPVILRLREIIFSSLTEYFPSYYSAQTKKQYEGLKFDFDLWGWLTVLDTGGFNSPHIHPRSTISGVFYVSVPTAVLRNSQNDCSGWLGFIDPRENSQIWPLPGHINHLFIPPEPGSLILFPSYLSHFVPPYSGEGKRVAIAFNLRHRF